MNLHLQAQNHKNNNKQTNKVNRLQQLQQTNPIKTQAVSTRERTSDPPPQLPSTPPTDPARPLSRILLSLSLSLSPLSSCEGKTHGKKKSCLLFVLFVQISPAFSPSHPLPPSFHPPLRSFQPCKQNRHARTRTQTLLWYLIGSHSYQCLLVVGSHAPVYRAHLSPHPPPLLPLPLPDLLVPAPLLINSTSRVSRRTAIPPTLPTQPRC